MVAQARAEGLSVVLLQIDRTRNLEVHVAYRGPEFLYLPNLDSLYLPRDAAELAGLRRAAGAGSDPRALAGGAALGRRRRR
ncbi:hypothetical protein ACU4GR_04900 [Methylobacterium oryzae CBMB20]